MEKKQYDWICGEIPRWVECGIVTQEQAQRILSYYQDAPKKSAIQLSTLFGGLGAIFIGLGVILILAYNWDDLSRSARLGVAIGLLACSQIGTYYNGTRQAAERYREAWAVFQSLMVGAGIGLMGQTYHMDLQFDRFLLVWMALILPLAYLTNTVLPVLLYGILGIIWAGMVRDTSLVWLGWLGLAALLPLLRQWCGDRVRRRVLIWGIVVNVLFFQVAWVGHFQGRDEIWLLWALLAFLYCLRSHIAKLGIERYDLLAWIAALDVVFVFFVTCEVYFGAFTPQILCLLAISMFVWGLWLETAEENSQRPLTLVGFALSLLICFFLSFRYGWNGWGQDYASALSLMGSLVALTAFALWRANLRMRVSSPEKFHALMAPLIMGAVLLNAPIASVWLVNGYLFLWGILLFKLGLDDWRAGWLNDGLAMISALIIARFFDTNVSFLVRGVVYLSLGGGFIALNYWLRQRKGARGNED